MTAPAPRRGRARRSRSRSKARQGGAAAPGRRGRPGGREAPSPRSRPATATPAGGSWSPTREGLLAARRPGEDPVLACRAWRPATPDADRVRVGGPHGGLRAVRRGRRSRSWPERRPAGPWPSCRPGRPRRARSRWCWPEGAAGILFHEACGHGLEADHIVKDASVYVGQVGQQVASPLVTLVDDGTVGREWGTFAVDDEGRPAQRNVLIENGVLTDYMWDCLRARKEGRALVGQRPAPELPAPAHGADDQHLPAARRGGPRRDRGPDAPRRLRGQARRRPGQHGHRRLRLRDDRGLPDRGRARSPSRSATPT